MDFLVDENEQEVKKKMELIGIDEEDVVLVVMNELFICCRLENKFGDSISLSSSRSGITYECVAISIILNKNLVVKKERDHHLIYNGYFYSPFISFLL